MKRIKALLLEYPNQWSKVLRSRPELLQLLDSTKSKYNFSDRQIKEAVYCLLNDYSPICHHGNIRKLKYYKDGFKNCGNKDKCKCNGEQVKKTCLAKYGVDSFSKTVEFVTKGKETKLERYDDANFTNTTQMQSTKLDRYGDAGFVNPDKAKVTKLDRYGDAGFVNPDKAKVTKLDRYGDENYNNTDKMKKTKIDRYGDENYNNRESAKETNLDRYGVDNFAKTDEFVRKINQTNNEKYGVLFYQQRNWPKQTVSRLNDKEWLVHQHHTLAKPLVEIGKILGANTTTVSAYFKKHNIDIKYFSQSYPEKLIIEFIDTKYNSRILSNIRTIIPPREIDIWLPEFHLAIEFNGKYWHHPDRYNSIDEWRKYHKSKEEECNAVGIRLLHLWEGYGDHKQLLVDAIDKQTIVNDYTIYD